jgi:DNA-directed RNA polymerase subunit M/transcription elongation factor TFIIS
MEHQVLEHGLRTELAKNLLAKKMKKEKWSVPPEKIKLWFEKVNEHMSHYRSFSVLQFQLDEIFHYLTLEELTNTIVPSKSEHNYVIQLYKSQSEAEIQLGMADHNKNLQSPDVTFKQVLTSALCPKCKHEATSMTIQKRSADEPSQYFHECKNTNCKWKWKEG